MPSRRELANAIRALSMDAVEKATCGHPGAPMGMADIAEVLWNDYLKHNPANPKWWDRDRFVMSNGHGSMLVYSLLHLSGYDLSIDEIKQFRQLHSQTPGHPEYGYTPGVETTTGPLGQGITNAVGMALAEKLLANEFNRDGFPVVDHHTYVFLGDGCLMEGVSHEACSLAGTLGLNKLIGFYDDNGISIDGEVEGWFMDDTPMRFEAYGWHVIRGVDGHDPDAIKTAIEAARASDKPSLICCKTIIGFGSPNMAGTHDVHGAALGKEEIAATRENIGWKHEPFVIPQDIMAGWDGREKGAATNKEWQTMFENYKNSHGELAEQLERRMNGELPAQWSQIIGDYIKAVDANKPKLATRQSSNKTLDEIAPKLPELLGGSADLSGSNGTLWKGATPLRRNNSGNYVNYGVREFGMTAIMNGIALHGGFIPYGGTFLVFSDYARNGVRMAALMKLRNILVYTHDSIGLGEDGPTHQPVEHVASLRLIPNLAVWRPCDAVETAVSWAEAIERKDGPTALILTRQGLANQTRDQATLDNIRKGGYVLKGADNPDAIIIATGSEVETAMAAAGALEAEGKKISVVSMPCVELFDAQDQSYKDSVLPPAVKARVAIEAGCTEGWHRFVGDQGKVMGLNRFGESAPAPVLYKHFKLTSEDLEETVKSLL